VCFIHFIHKLSINHQYRHIEVKSTIKRNLFKLIIGLLGTYTYILLFFLNNKLSVSIPKKCQIITIIGYNSFLFHFIIFNFLILGTIPR